MKNNTLEYEVTPIALEYFNQRNFEIIFDVFNCMQTSDDESIKDYIYNIGSEELYESLKYHNEIIYSSLLTKNYNLITNFLVWKYSVYNSRNIDLNSFFKEYQFWKQSISTYLYPSHASEINTIYDFLISNHEEIKKRALKIKQIQITTKHKELFNDLLFILLNGEKHKFNSLIKKHLSDFNNDVFLLIEELINPLMYKVGQMWQLSQLSVAKEHLASSLIEEVINNLIKTTFINKHKPMAIISTVGNELHNLGIKVVGKFIENYGYNVKNLSSKISNKELINSIYDLKPNLVLLSITLPSNIASLQQIVKELKSDYNLFSGLVIVGGQGLLVDKKLISIKYADFSCRNLNDLKSFLTIKEPDE